MFFNKKYLVIVPLVLFALACNKDKPTSPEPPGVCWPVDPCENIALALGISEISGPSNISLGQAIVLNVMSTGINGCAVSAEITGTPSTTGILLSSSVVYVGCVCTQALTEIASTYTFTPTNAGTYTFHSIDLEGNPIQHTVTVQ